MKRARRRRWPDDVFVALKEAGIGQVGYVADAGHAQLIAAAHADSDMRAVVLTTKGAAAMIGLGLAMVQPSCRVLVLTGDGGMLMGMGSLATIELASRLTSRSRSWTRPASARPGRN